MVTFCPGREQARLQGDIGLRVTEHRALTGPHLWMEIASTPASRTPGIKEWLRLVERLSVLPGYPVVQTRRLRPREGKQPS